MGREYSGCVALLLMAGCFFIVRVLLAWVAYLPWASLIGHLQNNRTTIMWHSIGRCRTVFWGNRSSIAWVWPLPSAEIGIHHRSAEIPPGWSTTATLDISVGVCHTLGTVWYC